MPLILCTGMQCLVSLSRAFARSRAVPLSIAARLDICLGEYLFWFGPILQLGCPIVSSLSSFAERGMTPHDTLGFPLTIRLDSWAFFLSSLLLREVALYASLFCSLDCHPYFVYLFLRWFCLALLTLP